jgi:uncharacterized protein YjbI with pentapeptide repeats
LKECLVGLLIISAFGFSFLGASAESTVAAQEDGLDGIRACVEMSSGTLIILADGESCESRKAARSRQKGGSVGGSDFRYATDLTSTDRGVGDSLVGRAFSNLGVGDGYPGGNWQGVNLSTALVRFGSLKDADFTGSNLQGTRFVDGTLEDCNFTDANLLGASFEDWQSMSGSTWSNTICPDGTNSDNNGGTCVGHLAPSL